MNRSWKSPLDRLAATSVLFTALLTLTCTTALLAQNPNSGTTTTGQVLTVNITSPLDGTTLPGQGPCETTVEGVVTLGSAPRTNVSVMYVIDVSGSTADPFVFPPTDVNGDGVINSGDDFNGDGSNGDILDAEIAGALALNTSIHNFGEVSVGMIAYASQAASADVSPATGFQNFVSPPQADGQANGTPDIEEVLRSLDSQIVQGGSIDLFQSISEDSLGNSTNFEAALQALLAALATRPAAEQKLVYFLSDGRNETGGTIDDEIAQAAAAGIIVNTVGITSNSDPTLLRQIAEGTGGSFTQVNNPAELRVVLPTIPLVGIAEVSVNEQPVTLSAVGTFSTMTVLTGGPNVISATAIADDQTRVTASVSVTCGAEPLECELQIIEPADGSLICNDQVSVKAVSRVTGGRPPLSRQCTINGQAVVSPNDTLVASVTVGADNLIIATCTYTDAENNSITCRDTIAVRRPESLQCALTITPPGPGTFFCDDSVTVRALLEILGGAPPYLISGNINGMAAGVVGSELRARISLTPGENILVATASITDSCGTTTSCRDTLRLVLPLPLQCALEIQSPTDASICDDSVDVTGVINVTDGNPPFRILAEVNGLNAVVIGHSFSVRVPLTAGENLLIVTSTVTDTCGATTTCSDSIRVNTTEPTQCAVKIESPADGAVICGDSVKVVARSGQIQISSVQEPQIVCEINGVRAVHANGTFSATVPLLSDSTLILASCTITDDCGNTSVCRDSIRVLRSQAPVVSVKITSPEDGDSVCGDSLTVEAKHTIAGGFPPFAVQCEINGIQSTPTDSLFSATLALTSGNNGIVAVCRVEDSCGRVTVSRDSITVFRDDVPPTCSFKNEGLNIKGVFSDQHSGIAQFVPVKLKNSKLTVDQFTPGAKTVNFLLEPIDPDKPTGFSIDIIDICGNRFNCDPIFLRLEADRAARQIDFTFPATDRYLELTNFGLTEVRFDLNGHKFKFTSDLARVHSEPNTFLLARDERLTIDLGNYLQGDDNAMFIAYAGPAGTMAEIFLLDHIHDVDFILNLKALPAEFRLSQNYPNPFNPTTQIRIDIPERLNGGVQTQVKIYNLLGELVRVVMDEQKFPGQHIAEWDGRNENGESVSSGIYIYQLLAGEFRETKRMVLLK